jgi:hypothetical protein
MRTKHEFARRVLAAGPAVLAAAGTIALLAGPSAQASVPSDRCPQGYVCFWTGEDFSGEMRVYNNPAYHDCAETDGGARTVFNNDDQTWSFYADQSCGAHVTTLESGEYYSGRRVHSWK